jgi:hypothetical protein
MKPPKRIPRISAKKLKALGGKVPFSSIAPKHHPKGERVKKPKKSKPIGRGPMPQRRTPVPKANPERQKRAAKRGAAKHRAYMASETRKVVDDRAGGRCEVRTILRIADRPKPAVVRMAGVALPGEHVMLRIGDRVPRCEETEGLQHHHKTYARYGGNELPEDIVVACKPHHDYLESLKPAGNRRSRSKGKAA